MTSMYKHKKRTCHFLNMTGFKNETSRLSLLLYATKWAQVSPHLGSQRLLLNGDEGAQVSPHLGRHSLLLYGDEGTRDSPFLVVNLR